LLTSRRAIGEVIGSVSMLAVTIALLAGASAVAVMSIRDASNLVQGSSQEQQREAGILVSLVTAQSNSSGTYLWLYDYGWVSQPVKDVYVQGESVGWTSTCGSDWAGRICTISIVPPEKGTVTVIISGISIAATV